MTQVAFLYPLAGGVLIGLAAAALLLLNGQIAGISSITSGLVAPRRGDVRWRASFLLGLVAGGALVAAVRPAMFSYALDRSTVAIAAAGLLVGIGTSFANGCTSGHGVCGVSRMSRRSLVATGTFMLTGVVAVFVVEHLIGVTL